MCAEAHGEGSRAHLRNCKAHVAGAQKELGGHTKDKGGKQIWELSMLGLRYLENYGKPQNCF